MTLVRFALETGDGTTVSYDLDFVPRVGEHITAAGDDPEVPAGTYEVVFVRYMLALRGDRGTVVSLRLIAQPDLPEDVEPGLARQTAESEAARLRALAQAEYPQRPDS